MTITAVAPNSEETTCTGTARTEDSAAATDRGAAAEAAEVMPGQTGATTAASPP